MDRRHRGNKSERITREDLARLREIVGDNVRIIYEQEPQRCDLCGKIAELRPYGPNGEAVCFTCGMKDEEAARRRFMEQFNED